MTEFFLELKTDKTPAIVERIVNDIDEIVSLVRFDRGKIRLQVKEKYRNHYRKLLLNINYIKTKNYSINLMNT